MTRSNNVELVVLESVVEGMIKVGVLARKITVRIRNSRLRLLGACYDILYI